MRECVCFFVIRVLSARRPTSAYWIKVGQFVRDNYQNFHVFNSKLIFILTSEVVKPEAPFSIQFFPTAPVCHHPPINPSSQHRRDVREGHRHSESVL